jgi:hypothetical protein
MCPGIGCRTHVAQACVNDAMHLCDSPLDHVAKALVIDKKVLPAHRTLCSFFEFILTMARANGSVTLGPQSQFRGLESESSRLYQPIFFQSSHELVELFDLQSNPSCQVVVLEAA